MYEAKNLQDLKELIAERVKPKGADIDPNETIEQMKTIFAQMAALTENLFDKLQGTSLTYEQFKALDEWAEYVHLEFKKPEQPS